jgi:branched-chain amino acid transport system substrate-binding protein
MMIRSTRSRALVALLVVLALAAAACGGAREDSAGDNDDDNSGESTGTGDEAADFLHVGDCSGDPTQGVTDDTIKIGSSFPQSGTYAAFAEISTGYQAYFDYVNEELGGIDGRQIELTTLDDAYEPGRTATNAQRLVQDEGVFALFNVIGTSNNTAIWDDLEDECVPNLFAGTGSPLWGDPDHAWTIGSFPSYSLEAVMYAHYLEENQPDATVALLTQNDDFGQSYVDTFKDAIEGTDITVVGEETYDFTNPDTTSQVTSLADTGADAVVLGTTALACPNALNAIHGSSWDPTIFISGTCTSPTLVGLAEPGAADGIISVTAFKDPRDPQWDDDEAMQLFKEKGREYGGADIDIDNTIVAYGWTMGALLVDTLSNAEELTRPAVMEQALNIDDLVTGLALPDSAFNTSIADGDKFPEEVLQLMQYSDQLGYYEFLGDPQDFEGQTADVTPENLLTAN